MTKPSDFVIRRVLNEKATAGEAARVAAWFATPEGQVWLAEEFDRDLQQLESGGMASPETLPSGEMMRQIDRILLRRRRRRWLFRIAAVLIPCVLLVGFWINLNTRMGGILFSEEQMMTVSTQPGERKELIFQDGTRVVLNAASKITYPTHFGVGKRHVSLDGEAYFEVAHNPHRSFEVKVDAATTLRVLGTSFDLKAYAADRTIDVVLLQGSVEFAHADVVYRLKPAQRLVFDKVKGCGAIFDEENAGESMLWSSDTICFRDAPLKEVAAGLERWYGISIRITQEELYDYTFSFQTGPMPLDKLLAELENIAPIRCRQEGDEVTISGI